MRRPNRRCAYHCSIIDVDNKPIFRIRIQENLDEPPREFSEPSAKAVWHKIVDEIDLLRRKHGLVKMFSIFVSGEDLYGLTVSDFESKIPIFNEIIFSRNHISYV
jgi:hypothetical protein